MPITHSSVKEKDITPTKMEEQTAKEFNLLTLNWKTESQPVIAVTSSIYSCSRKTVCTWETQVVVIVCNK